MRAPPPRGVDTRRGRVGQRLRLARNPPSMLAGGFDRTSAEAALAAGQADLIAFGRPYLANPDLVERMLTEAQLSEADAGTFYTPGAKGYTDYPALADAAVAK